MVEKSINMPRLTWLENFIIWIPSGDHTMVEPKLRMLWAIKSIFLVVIVLIPILATVLMYMWSNAGIGESYQNIDEEHRA